MSAGGVAAARPAPQQARSGASPTPALQTSACIEPRDLSVKPIDSKTARLICEKHHYLHSYPAGGLLNFGIFADHALVGAVVFGVGPYNAHRYFADANRGQVITLARLWLDDRCGRNSESRILGVICRMLRRWQATAKAIVAYSDPAAGHDGAIYRAAGFSYLGMSGTTPLYRLPNGNITHSRSLGHSFGTRSLAYFKSQGIHVQTVHLGSKHIYVACIDPSWLYRIKSPILPYLNRS